MFKSIIPGALAFLLWYMQIIDPNISIENIEQNSAAGALWTAFKFYLYSYRAMIGAIASFLVVTFSLKDSVYKPRRESQSIVHNQLKEIMDDCFPKKRAQVRLTVFKRVPWSEAVLHYAFHCLVHGLKQNGLKALQGFWVGFPRVFSNHLIIFSRLGSPSQGVLTTTFSIPDDEEKAEGFVGKAWVAEDPIKVQLPDIRDVPRLREARTMNELDEPNRKIVREYMEKGNLADFSKLQSIHRYSTFIWAATIYDAGNEAWGVLVLDSSEKEGLTAQKEQKLVSYRESIRKIIVREKDRAS